MTYAEAAAYIEAHDAGPCTGTCTRDGETIPIEGRELTVMRDTVRRAFRRHGQGYTFVKTGGRITAFESDLHQDEDGSWWHWRFIFPQGRWSGGVAVRALYQSAADAAKDRETGQAFARSVQR